MGRNKAGAVLAALFVLSACGGGGGSGGGSPTPSPSPSPSPSPTTSPTPSPSYTTYSALTGSRSFAVACEGLTQNGLQTFAAQPIPFGTNNLDFAFDAATPSYTIAGKDPTGPYAVNQTFGPADAVTPTNAEIEKEYRIVPGNGQPPKVMLIGAPKPGGSTLQYGRILYYSLPNTSSGEIENRYCVFGVPTLTSDRPTGSSVAYSAFAFNGSIRRAFDDGSFTDYRLAASNIAISVNLTTYTLSISMQVTGTLSGKTTTGTGSTQPNTIDLGTLTANNVEIQDSPANLGGLFNFQDTTKQIPFQGWFFGPQGKEFAIAMSYSSRDAEIMNRTWGTTGLMFLTASR